MSICGPGFATVVRCDRRYLQVLREATHGLKLQPHFICLNSRLEPLGDSAHSNSSSQWLGVNFMCQKRVEKSWMASCFAYLWSSCLTTHRQWIYLSEFSSNYLLASALFCICISPLTFNSCHISRLLCRLFHVYLTHMYASCPFQLPTLCLNSGSLFT